MTNHNGNDEIRMAAPAGRGQAPAVPSSFGLGVMIRHSDFVIRHSVRAAVALACTFLLGPISPASADVAIHPPFGDNMVLQRDIRVPVWGTADPGEEVTVTMAGQKRKVIASHTSRWMVRLDPLPAGGPMEMTIAGKNTIRLQNVLVGEVWLCAGQSNMEMPLGTSRRGGWTGVLNSEQEIAQADHPLLRVLTVEARSATEPQPFVTGTWNVCTPDTAPAFSAAAYFMGRDLHKTLGVPVGLIVSALGPSLAQAWIGKAALDDEPALSPVLDRWQRRLADLERAGREHQLAIEKWNMAAKEAADRGEPAPPEPEPLVDSRMSYRPSGLYDGMIAPLAPFAIRGVAWYQGESDVLDAPLYHALFRALIRDWRRTWGQGDFPFLFVQLANFDPKEKFGSLVRSPWAELREAQASALLLPNTAMAIAIDIGETDNIHPRNKQEVGRRLALAALASAYGRRIVSSGPLYDSQVIEGSAIRVYFRSVGSGLAPRAGDDLPGFTIAAAEDRQFVPAHARIEGRTVLVWTVLVPHPVAVRYAWSHDPACGLANVEGLPAAPFRTDQWPPDEFWPPPPTKLSLPYGDLVLLALVGIALAGYLVIQLRRPRLASEQ